MVSLTNLRKEHVKIGVEIDELEAVMSSDEINYPNLIHVFKNLVPIWNSHEDKEEKLFSRLQKEYPALDFSVVDRMLFDHKELKGHRKVVSDAISSGSEFEIKIALDTDGRMMLDKIRRHIKDENELFDNIQHMDNSTKQGNLNL
ncbi:MAG: hemerythrin domain-containing protein [Candidatus Pacearchaeota archaeon]|jgi:hemerythrin-like domain-containing protein